MIIGGLDMAEVNVELYEFLRARECHIEFRNERKDIEAFVFIHPSDIIEFDKIVGNYFSDTREGFVYGSGSFCFTSLIDLVEYFGHDIRGYRHCFYEGAEWFEGNKDDLSKILD